MAGTHFFGHFFYLINLSRQAGKTGNGRNRLIATPDTKIFIEDKCLDKYVIWAPGANSATIWRRKDFVYCVGDESKTPVTYGDIIMRKGFWSSSMIVGRKVNISGQEIEVECESWPDINAENIQHLPEEYRDWATKNMIIK